MEFFTLIDIIGLHCEIFVIPKNNWVLDRFCGNKVKNQDCVR